MISTPLHGHQGADAPCLVGVAHEGVDQLIPGVLETWASVVSEVVDLVRVVAGVEQQLAAVAESAVLESVGDHRTDAARAATSLCGLDSDVVLDEQAAAD